MHWVFENNEWCGVGFGDEDDQTTTNTEKVIDCSDKIFKININLSISDSKKNDKPVPFLINFHPIMGSTFDFVKEIVDVGKCKLARPFPILNFFRCTTDNVVSYNRGLLQVVPGSPKTNTPDNNCKMYNHQKLIHQLVFCTINGRNHSESDGKMEWEFLKQFFLP
ncbi:hypothetical protein BCR32DRAFT_276794 [Anaeromyces robustus]|uniref:Uncharacterized protein n=1 Tax=Anaeromyces robustus TaxID=1754192 RepID=A0A1Y1XGH4_9FUNG|nr:hypothetical protein BCR32DRAFT_276794 [Anaeromyces robustus]|eukprot:ORX84823.1 hypothetical protein BCR32DRAFT_276794 [Anaeromyces robustus]